MTAEELETLIDSLANLTSSELRHKWAELFGTHCYTRGRSFLIRRITWRLRNQFLGGLTDRAQGRAELICDETLIRFQPKRYTYANGEPLPANVIRKQYKGILHEVTILGGGRYAYEQQIYHDLTSIAWKIAGYKISGNTPSGLPPLGLLRRLPPERCLWGSGSWCSVAPSLQPPRQSTQTLTTSINHQPHPQHHEKENLSQPLPKRKKEQYQHHPDEQRRSRTSSHHPLIRSHHRQPHHVLLQQTRREEHPSAPHRR